MDLEAIRHWLKHSNGGLVKTIWRQAAEDHIYDLIAEIERLSQAHPVGGQAGAARLDQPFKHPWAARLDRLLQSNLYTAKEVWHDAIRQLVLDIEAAHAAGADERPQEQAHDD